jgi:LysM repeat protein
MRRLVRRFAAVGAAVCLLGGVLAVLVAVAPAYAQDSSSTTTTPASSSIVLGSSNTDSAVVTGDDSFGSPTGTVTFYECGPTTSATPCTSETNQVGTPVSVTAGASDTSSATSVSFTPTSTGYWCFAGQYSGDSNYGASSDTTTDECFDVTAATSSTTTTPASSSIVLGSANTDSAVVTGVTGGLAPTGTVTFYECGPTTSATPCTSVTNEVGTPVSVTAGASDTSSATSVSFTPTSTGYWCFAGQYSGDSNYGASSDTTIDECFDVTAATSSTTSAPEEPTIVFDGSDADIASVVGNSAGGAPTGTISFYYCYADTAPVPCTAKLNKVGTGTVTLTPGANDTSSATSANLSTVDYGYYCFGAYYSGSSNYLSSADTAVAECFDVVHPAPTITSFSPASGAPGATVTIKGTNLSGATTVTIGGKVATIISDGANKIKVKVPTGAHSGVIRVTTAGGTAVSSAKFKVT